MGTLLVEMGEGCVYRHGRYRIGIVEKPKRVAVLVTGRGGSRCDPLVVAAFHGNTRRCFCQPQIVYTQYRHHNACIV